CRQGLEFPFTF
nr:immunoglobulin light chain junction region [Macaca mulatta]MOW39712.1 immunoglobulin light chain junction region [Macaca mulatta]MOW40379.1 immunoglobulin light chain junction region [Macaca mulatta]MOW40443.1 immunoglobulin light chain junction region [Macaca mulatta]